MRQSKITWEVKKEDETQKENTNKKRRIQTKLPWEIRDDCWKKEIEAINLACALNDQQRSDNENNQSEKKNEPKDDHYHVSEENSFSNIIHEKIKKQQTNNDDRDLHMKLLSNDGIENTENNYKSKNKSGKDDTVTSMTKKNDDKKSNMNDHTDGIEQSSTRNELINVTDQHDQSRGKESNDEQLAISDHVSDSVIPKTVENDYLAYVSGECRTVPLVRKKDTQIKRVKSVLSSTEEETKRSKKKTILGNYVDSYNNDVKEKKKPVGGGKLMRENEESLLAGALGNSAIVANTIDYESSVLANSQMTPTIPQLLPSGSQSEWECGYPSLGNNADFSKQAWEQTFHRVDDLLHPTYAKKESETAIILRMQYFAILQHLQKTYFSKQQQSSDGSENHLLALLNPREQKKYEKERKLQFEKRKHSLSLQRNNKRKHKKSSVVGDESDDNNYNNNDSANIMTPTQRLEQVKKGKNINILSLSFNTKNTNTVDENSTNNKQGQTQALAHRQYHTAIFVWRKAQKRKRRNNRSSGDANGDDYTDPLVIYQKRKQRWERRLLRRQKYISEKPTPKTSKTSSVPKTARKRKQTTKYRSSSISTRKNTEKKNRVKKTIATATDLNSKTSNMTVTMSPSTTSTSTSSTTKKSLTKSTDNNEISGTVDNMTGLVPNSTTDTLATDMDIDKSRNNADTTSTNKCKNAWSTRPRRNATKRIISYAEVEDEIIEHDKSKDDIFEIDNNDELDNDNEEKDDNLEVEIECLEDDIIGDEEQTSECDDIINQFDYDHENPPLDDWFEYDYEDRVDYWIEKCQWNQMSLMKEADANEVPPGAVQYCSNNSKNYGDDPNRGKVLNVPAWVNNALFPYQRTGLQWMWELYLQQCGGIVGDEMGLGKTGCLAAGRHIKSVLIIAPATILSSWLSHLKIWAPGLRRILIHKSHDSSHVLSKKLINELNQWLETCRQECWYEAIDEEDLRSEKNTYNKNIIDTNDDKWNKFCGTGYVVVTTFENLRRNSDVYISNRWSYVVMDEGQKIRNPDADVTLACKRIRTPHRLLLSGTPIQNDLRELWSLFDFVFPGRLGTLPTFESEFAEPIKKGRYANASPAQVQLAYRCALILRDLINPFLLRRQKKDIKEVSRMPGKTEHVLFCKLTSTQRSMYEAYLKSDEVTNVIRGSAQSFRPIIILRKICNHPDLLADDDPSSFNGYIQNDNGDSDTSSDRSSGKGSLDKEDSFFTRSGKLEVLAKILPLWKEQGHRVLIFSQWKKMLNIIQHFLVAQGYNFLRMDGDTNVASRQTLVDSFNSDDTVFAMLLTTRTGGVGLNLTGADRIILYDPDWNPQSDSQARERAWRFGQRNAVTVYRLITAGTIEEKIYHRQIFKTALTNQVLQDPRQKRLFSQRDLRDLFTLKPESDNKRGKSREMTETAEITKGQGVIKLNECDEKQESNQNDNKDTLELVMKGKGLAGVFDHDFVDKSSSAKKSLSVKEMEKQAKKIAEESAKALRQSSRDQDRFTPTWTGSSKTETQRFGRSSQEPTNQIIQQKRKQNKRTDFDNKFGGASTAGLRNTPHGTALSSSTLLAKLKERSAQIENAVNKEH